jgi:hypothetical protein
MWADETFKLVYFFLLSGPCEWENIAHSHNVTFSETLSQLKTHLTSEHAEMAVVKSYLQCTDDEGKKRIFAALRNQGNHMHNMTVLSTGRDGHVNIVKP